ADMDDAPITNARYRVAFDGNLLTGSTDGNGLLQVTLPIDVKTATLTVQDYEWELLIAELNPVEHTPDNGASGIQARLHNLGYDVGPIDGIIGPRTQEAIRAFQEDH